MKRWLGPAGLYLAITIALTFPLLRHFASAFPHDAGDPVLNSWILWWSTRHIPFTSSWWNAPMFAPMAGAMALSELLIGLLPITAPVQWLTHSPLTAYNVAFLLSFPLSGLAAYALTAELTGRRDAALVAGIAFAFAPYRMGQLAHVQMLSYYWTPVALLGLHRYLRASDRKWLALFGSAWLMQALSNGYALFHVSILVAFWVVWFARSARAAVPILVVWIVSSMPLVPLLLKYQEVHTFLHLTRNINEIKGFGVDLADFLSAPPETLLWGSRLWPARPETSVFPGATLLVVGAFSIGWAWRRSQGNQPSRTLDQQIFVVLSAVAGLVALSAISFGPWSIGPLTVTDFHKPFSLAVGFRLLASLRSPWMRAAWRERSVVVFYAVAMVGAYILALGPEPRLLGRPLLYQPPYSWLMHLPGFGTLRVPARFAMIGVLCQSVLLAFAMTRWAVSSRRTTFLAIAISVGLLADSWIRLSIGPAPAPGPAWTDVAAVIELPIGGTGEFDAIYRSMSHGLPIANGYSGFFPPHYLPLVFAIRDRQYSALYEIAVGRPLGVAVNRSAPDAAEIEAAVGVMDGVRRGPVQNGWATFTVYRRAPGSVPTGAAIRIASVHANRQDEDIGRLTDRNLETAWGSGTNQIGDEEVTADLGSVRSIGAIAFDMGAYAFGFPRALEIDASADGREWAPVWGGRPAVLAVHGAVVNPGIAPLTIDLGQVSARFVRFRQTGSEPGIPWWIAELNVFAPPETASR